MNEARWAPHPLLARIAAVAAAVVFGIATYTLLGTSAVDTQSIFNPLLHGLGLMSGGLVALSLYAAVRPFPEESTDVKRGKECKFCLEAMRSYATRCPHCGAEQA